MSKTRTKKTIAVDFDGVIHTYDKGYQDGSIYGEPIESAFEGIKNLMDRGYSVYIFSTRKPRQIQKWLNNYLWYRDAFAEVARMEGKPVYDTVFTYGFSSRPIRRWEKFWNKDHVLGITNRKIPAMAYLDDRAVRFTSWEQAMEDLR